MASNLGNMLAGLFLAGLYCSGAQAGDFLDCEESALIDSGFESGTTGGWNVSVASDGPVIITDESLARTGLGFAVLGGAMGDESAIAQTVTFPVGGQVLLEMWVAQPGDSGGDEQLTLRIDDTEPEIIELATGTPDADYRFFSFDLSAFADGDKHSITVRADIEAESATRWHLDDFCLGFEVPVDTEGEDEGEPEGEGTPEGEVMPEGEMEGEAEGEGEGAPEGETEGESCALEEVRITYPEEGALFYVGGDISTFNLGITAQADCEADTREIRFFSRSGAGSFAFLTADQAAPFGTNATLLDLPETERSIDLRVEGIPRNRPAPSEPDELIRDTVSVFVRGTGTADTLGNGLPDQPFTTLNRAGSSWLTQVTLPGAAAAMVASAHALYGFDPLNGDEDRPRRDITVRLENPKNTAQQVVARFSEELVEDDEVGVMIVQVASDLTGVVGETIATGFRREPTGRFDGDGVYVAVAGLIAQRGQNTFTAMPAARLAAHPIEVSIEGITFDSAEEYVLAYHGIGIQQSGAGIQITSSGNSWQTVGGASLDLTGGLIDSTVPAFGIYAPYRLVEEVGPCESPDCFNANRSIFYLILVALGILQIAEGGGGPCFIATAAYGTPLAAELDVLRHFRDAWLLQSAPGTAFVDAYYRISPTLADWVAQSPPLAAAVRLALIPVLLVAAQPWWALCMLVAGWFIFRQRTGWNFSVQSRKTSKNL